MIQSHFSFQPDLSFVTCSQQITCITNYCLQVLLQEQGVAACSGPETSV